MLNMSKKHTIKNLSILIVIHRSLFGIFANLQNKTKKVKVANT